jgi:nicotinamide-nucleotide amidase
MREHATAAIVSQGDEIVLGQTLDTNSRWIAEQLVDLGVSVVEHVSVPDDLGAITRTITRLAAGVDLVVCTGGLGPTADDLTRDALAHAMGEALVEDPISLEQVRAFFAARKRDMPEINRVQSLRPASARSLPNLCGTAPGLLCTMNGGADVFCLPGPPGELRAMFEHQVMGRLRPPGGRTVRTLALHTIGLGESDVATRLGALMARSHMPLVGTTASGAVVSVRLRCEGVMARERADELLAETGTQVRRVLGAHVFAEGGTAPDPLPAAVVAKLRSDGRTLGVVESCTAGLLGSMVGGVPGASDVFAGGGIVYHNSLKTSFAGVRGETLAAHGAVSRECAIEMARGGLDACGVSDCLAITGIAGPGGASPGKPVGTVWIALARRTTGGDTRLNGGGALVDVRRFAMLGDRTSVQAWSARMALAILWLHLSGAPTTRLLREVNASEP